MSRAHIPSLRIPCYRAWIPDQERFKYLEGIEDLIDWEASQKATDDGNGCVDVCYRCDLDALEPDTTLVDATGRPIYANDLVTFTIAGITHGPEPEDVGPVQVWWCAEQGCWAFGRWTETLPSQRSYDWWYTMADNIRKGSLRVVGNVHQNPELLKP